jgi:hypothetical protein
MSTARLRDGGDLVAPTSSVGLVQAVGGAPLAETRHAQVHAFTSELAIKRAQVSVINGGFLPGETDVAAQIRSLSWSA